MAGSAPVEFMAVFEAGEIVGVSIGFFLPAIAAMSVAIDVSDAGSTASDMTNTSVRLDSRATTTGRSLAWAGPRSREKASSITGS